MLSNTSLILNEITPSELPLIHILITHSLIHIQENDLLMVYHEWNDFFVIKHYYCDSTRAVHTNKAILFKASPLISIILF